MKGLAIVLGGKPKNDSDGASADEAKPKDSAMEFARLASEASAAGDHDSAAKALINAIRAYKATSYEEPAGEDEEE